MSLFQSVVGKDEAGGEVDGGEGGAVAEGRAADRGVTLAEEEEEAQEAQAQSSAVYYFQAWSSASSS